MENKTILKPQCTLATKVLFQNKNYSIEEYQNKNTNKPSLVVVQKELRTNWIIVYENKSIGLDFELPKFIKQKLYKLALNY